MTCLVHSYAEARPIAAEATTEAADCSATDPGRHHPLGVPDRAFTAFDWFARTPGARCAAVVGQ